MESILQYKQLNEDIENAAGIFTVAQVAVNQLEAQAQEAAHDSAQTIAEPFRVLTAAPDVLTKGELIERYGSYNGCRSAARRAGITFSSTPKWSQLIAGFSYLSACQRCIHSYLRQYPSSQLKGIRLSLSLEDAPTDDEKVIRKG